MTNDTTQFAPEAARVAHSAGVDALRAGRAEAGLPLLQRAVAIAPHVAQFQHDLGTALAMLDRHEDALECYGRAIAVSPGSAWLRCDAGVSLMALERVDEGAEELRMAASLSPDDPRILVNFGMALMRLRVHDRAALIFERSAELAPGHPAPWTRLSEALWSMGKFEQSEQAARRAVELSPADPGALVALGNVMQMTARFDEAIEQYERASRSDPDNYDAKNNLALTLLKRGDAKQALERCDSVIARWPQRVEAKVNRALMLMTLGDWARGFAEYEQRWELTALAERVERTWRQWDGSDPSGRSILIVQEQGLGDTIQLVRYATLLAGRGATVRVACPETLWPVVRTVKGVSEVVAPGTPPAEGELSVSLSSLPARFGTTVETTPAEVPYVSSDVERVTRWRKRLTADAGLKVGLVWGGGSGNDNDRARSCRLSEMSALAGISGVSFYSLQKGPPAGQLRDAPTGMRISDLGDELNDFGDTAAAIECLDLIVSVDTSVAHLAGAMGKRVWTLLYKGADWRWLIDREDSVWYPTMRLFRQEKLGDWAGVMERVAVELSRTGKETV